MRRVLLDENCSLGTCLVGEDAACLGLTPSPTVEVEAPEMQDRLVYCYPVRLAVPSPPLPNVEMHVENSLVCVRYKGEMVKVSRSYFSKLVRSLCGWAGGGQGGL